MGRESYYENKRYLFFFKNNAIYFTTISIFMGKIWLPPTPPPPYHPHHFSQLFRKVNHPQIKKVASLIEKLLLHFLYEKQIILGA